MKSTKYFQKCLILHFFTSFLLSKHSQILYNKLIHGNLIWRISKSSHYSNLMSSIWLNLLLQFNLAIVSLTKITLLTNLLIIQYLSCTYFDAWFLYLPSFVYISEKFKGKWRSISSASLKLKKEERDVRYYSVVKCKRFSCHIRQIAFYHGCLLLKIKRLWMWHHCIFYTGQNWSTPVALYLWKTRLKLGQEKIPGYPLGDVLIRVRIHVPGYPRTIYANKSSAYWYHFETN